VTAKDLQNRIVLQLVALLPWGHLPVLLDRFKDRKAHEWYLRAAVDDCRRIQIARQYKQHIELMENPQTIL
jgi:hypothetical protein